MSKAIAPRTNGDRVEKVVGVARKRLAEGVTWAREHPDEAVVAGLPVLLAWHLSLKYDMSLPDHLLITETSFALSRFALSAYQDWKARPARPAVREVA